TVRERYISIVRESSPFINAQIAQTVEQGLGRSVRSGSDYCSVFILDNALMNFIGVDKNRSFFASATKKQLDFGLELFGDEQPENVEQAIEEIRDAVEMCLTRDPEWRQFHKEMILSIPTEVPTDSKDFFDIADIEKTALEKYANDSFKDASDMVRQMVNTYSDPLSKVDQAWYLQIGAHILDHFDATSAVDMQVKA